MVGTMDLNSWIAKQLHLPSNSVQAVVGLLDQDNTVPFIARYRKEATGGLDETVIREIQKSAAQFRSLEERRQTILKSLTDQEVLSPELEEKIRGAQNKTTLEDLYLPFKPKRKTRASAARALGLQGLADLILAQAPGNIDLHAAVQPYLSESVPDTETAWQGARDIVAETISDHPQVRGATRSKAEKWGTLVCERRKGAEDPKGVYKLYYEFKGRVDRIRPYQILAINRGEKEKILRVKVDIQERDWRECITRVYRPHARSPFSQHLQLAIEDAARRLLLPAIDRDIRRHLTETAEVHAISVFGDNLRGLLSQPPLANQVILGIDPAYRTGCKVAVIDTRGKLLETETIYPHKPQARREEAEQILARLVDTHQVTLIVIGNGTASRETEQLVADFIRSERQARLHYLIVNEAGASVYSASPLARKEFPDLDVSLRGAVSIARRAQEPLAELVKIEPKAIGVGLYQHDVDQKLLTETLTGIVEDVVNQVGVDVNLASPALLTYVSGIGARLAEKIIAYRETEGIFLDRNDLLKVPGLGPKAFEQAAGFLRIIEGTNPLDNTGVHPEAYPVVRKLLEAMQDTGKSWADTVNLENIQRHLSRYRARFEDIAELADWLEIGAPTLVDIMDELEKPGRDPRSALPPPVLRQDILAMDDLQVGIQLKGTVRNVVDFGAFIDIGVKQDGLLHISKIPRGKILSVGDVVQVRVLRLDPDRGRIGLGLAGPD